MYETTYHRPSSVDDAVALFKKGSDSKYLAGGHTLLPLTAAERWCSGRGLGAIFGAVFGATTHSHHTNTFMWVLTVCVCPQENVIPKTGIVHVVVKNARELRDAKRERENCGRENETPTATPTPTLPRNFAQARDGGVDSR